MPRLEHFAERIDYGTGKYGRAPTLGEVLHDRAHRHIPGEITDEKVIKYFKLKKPAMGGMADFQEWQRRLRRLKDRMLDIETTLSGWTFKDAASYTRKIIAAFGPPTMLNERMAYWEGGVGPFSEVYVKDESIPHNFPAPHMDFVYSSMRMAVPPAAQKTLAAVTGSIIIDGLKGEVTARCGKLIKNAVTLGFVQDVIIRKMGEAAAKAEYSRRIKSNVLPDWYRDEMKEK